MSLDFRCYRHRLLSTLREKRYEWIKVLEFTKILCDKQESFSELKQNNDYNIRVEFNIHTAIEQVGYMLDAETMSNLARLGLHCDFKITLVGEGEFGQLLSTTLPSR